MVGKALVTVTRRSGAAYGSGRRSTPFSTEKTAVLAPIPKAKVTSKVTETRTGAATLQLD